MCFFPFYYNLVHEMSPLADFSSEKRPSLDIPVDCKISADE